MDYTVADFLALQEWMSRDAVYPSKLAYYVCEYGHLTSYTYLRGLPNDNRAGCKECGEQIFIDDRQWAAYLQDRNK